MILTVQNIQEAMKGDNFWLVPDSTEAEIIKEATEKGYVVRLSHTQVQWKDEEAIKKLAFNIHFKIEAKKAVCIHSETFQKYLEISKSVNTGGAKAFKELYKVYCFDVFMLPYKVKKLSKRARRNLI